MSAADKIRLQHITHVCSWCSEDYGEAWWTRGALDPAEDVSHGICDDCMAIHYPEEMRPVEEPRTEDESPMRWFDSRETLRRRGNYLEMRRRRALTNEGRIVVCVLAACVGWIGWLAL